MTSMLSEETSNVARMKQKLMKDGTVKEEARSFLSFSRENLSISHSDLEQGFNRSRLRPSRNTILSVAALVIALLCFGVESWKLRHLVENAREIEQLKRDVETLKHRFLQQDLMNELKAFEEQLYAEESTEDDDPGEADIDYADYDSNYDDDGSASHDYSGESPDDQHAPLIYGSKPSDFPEMISTPKPSSHNPGSNKAILELLTTLRKVEAKRGHEFEKNLRESHKNVERKHLKEEHKGRVSHEEKISDANNTEHKSNAPTGDTSSTGYTESTSQKKKQEEETRVKLKRSVGDRIDTNRPNHRRGERRQVRRSSPSRSRFHASNESEVTYESGTNSVLSTVSWDLHPPKKYHSHARLETSSATHDSQLSEEIVQHGHELDVHERTSERTNDADDRRVNWRNARRDAIGNRSEIHRYNQNFEMAAREKSRRRFTRRHLRAPRQVYAIHYEADSTLFTTADEHTGNGRVRHSSSVFKAWQPSDWVSELGMNRHFTLASDGKLTVHETGLYLAYAQIHYLDEHDENGFHLLVNGRPILQCMVYSPGIGHKSRSCFSAQVTVLHAGDHLVLKDVGSARYTLFQRDKSFFGLAKLGEPRQQQRHQT